MATRGRDGRRGYPFRLQDTIPILGTHHMDVVTPEYLLRCLEPDRRIRA
jgi:hypothetical protein